MRVLIVHNRYRSALPSGENNVVDDEVRLLGELDDVEVATFFRSNDEYDDMGLLRRLASAQRPVLGLGVRRSFRATLRGFRPDVVHLHNPYPLISPLIIDDCDRAGVPVVVTIHNFRLRCVNGIYFRDGRVCTDCESRRIPVSAVKHRCFAGSFSQSVVMATALARHRDRWDRVSRYIAVSPFIGHRLEMWGIPLDKIVVLPNPVDDPGTPTPPGEGFVYAARLSPEKGLRLVMDAWDESGLDGTVPLYVAGDGELKRELLEFASHHRSVHALGPLERAEVGSYRRGSAVGLQCSLWWEAHPAVAESFAHGRPVVATNVGALPTVLADEFSWSTDPDAASLAYSLRSATERSSIVEKGASARTRFLEVYEADGVAQRLRTALMEIAES